MPIQALGFTPSFATFKSSIKSGSDPLETSIANLISLLKRRRIRGSRDCAEATALLLRRVVENFVIGDVSKLMNSVQQVGQKLVAAAPKELVVGNIVRRVLGLIREEAEEDRESQGITHDGTVSGNHNRLTGPPPLRKVANRRMTGSAAADTGQDEGSASRVAGRSVFGLLSQPISSSVMSTTPSSHQSPLERQSDPEKDSLTFDAAKDLRAEVVEGILEILEELRQADDQIAGYAMEHIHANEIIMTHASSETVRKFLLKAATKRKFTVIHVESYPNHHEATHTLTTGEKYNGNEEKMAGHFQKKLTAAGITVILIPDSAIFAMMSRVNKVILDAHAVFADGNLISAVGAKQIAKAAHSHRTSVMLLSGVYKFSPVLPFNINVFLENGDPSNVIPYEEGNLFGEMEVENPLFDYVPGALIDLYVTNLGGYAPSYLYRIIADHYRSEDIELKGLEPFQ